jgi:hypothetical protein
MSGYTPVPAIAAGDILDEVFLMTYWVDNMAAMAPDVFSAKGQLIVGLDVDEMGVLNPGNDGDVLTVDSGETLGLIWKALALVKKRQGGSSTQWNTAGTTNYTPGTHKILAGTINIASISTAWNTWYYGNVSLTFPEAFADKPIVLCTPINMVALNIMGLIAGNVTATGCTIYAVANATLGNQNVAWLAVGE